MEKRTVIVATMSDGKHFGVFPTMQDAKLKIDRLSGEENRQIKPEECEGGFNIMDGDTLWLQLREAPYFDK
jgi:hypothetical protein